MRELDLEPPLRRGRALAEDFEDQPGAVDDLGPDLVFQVLLLDRGQRRVDDDQPRALFARNAGDFLRLPLADQRRRPNRADTIGARRGDDDADRFGEAFRFLDPGLGRAARALARKLGYDQDRALAAGDLDRTVAVEPVQDGASASSSGCAASSFSALAG